ncbi:MAG: hypothetical protein IJW29_00190 [Clostridia bacterium]|nr:hypothetical protein [Clostridia bacterium]
MMNDVWVLSSKTYFRDEVFINHGWKTSCRAFSDFAVAKREMRLLIKKYATEDNGMFDGRGGIVHFEEFIRSYGDTFATVKNFLRTFFTDENFPRFASDVPLITEEDEDCNDSYISCQCNEHECLIHEGEYATMTELEPYIHTNALFMKDSEKDYFCYISDLFRYNQYGCPSRIYIDLKKVSVEQPV